MAKLESTPAPAPEAQGSLEASLAADMGAGDPIDSLEEFGGEADIAAEALLDNPVGDEMAAPGEATPEPEPEPTPAEAPDPLAALAELMGVEATPEEAAILDLPEGVAPDSSAAKHLGKLQDRLTQYETGYTQLQNQANQQLQQMQQQMSTMQAENARLQGQMEAFNKYGPQAQQSQGFDEDNPYESLKARFLQETQGVYDPKIQELQSTISSLQEKLSGQEKAAELQQSRQYYRNAANKAAHSVLSRIPEETAQRLAPEFSTAVLARAYASGTDLETAAREEHQARVQYFLDYAKGAQSLRAKGQSLKAAVPKAPPTTGLPGKGRSTPSQEQLEAGGYNDHIDWEFAGRPPLPRIG